MTLECICRAGQRRRHWCAAAVAWPVLALSGCAGWAPSSVTFSEAELAGLLARHFPATRRVADLADLTLSAPRVWLLPERNRLGASFDLSAVERLFRNRAQGRMTLDSALRFEPADGSIRLSEVRVQQLTLDAQGLATSLTAQRLGALVAERLLEDLAVYQLKPDQAERVRRLGLKPGITVTRHGVELALAPSA